MVFELLRSRQEGSLKKENLTTKIVRGGKMFGWIVALIFFILAFIIWRRTKNSETSNRVKNLSTNARWLFGIFIFLNILDVWQSFFTIIWLHIAIELNPIFGRDLTLPMMIAAKLGVILLFYCALKYISMRCSIKNFKSFSVTVLILICTVMAFATIHNEYLLYDLVYDIVQSGFFL